MPAAVNFKSFMLRTEKVRMELGKGNINGGGYWRLLRVRLALIMETIKGTEESLRGLCEISSSTRPVNEPKQEGKK